MVSWGQGQSVVLVTSHPDDESMFFAPTLQHLICVGAEVHVLCLSTGNAEGLGNVRSDELVQACGVLGVLPKNVTVVDHKLLQDGMHVKWDASIIKSSTLDEIKHRSATMVQTDDRLSVAKGTKIVALMFVAAQTGRLNSGDVDYEAAHGIFASACVWIDSFFLGVRMLRELFADGSIESGIELWILESTNLIRKFCGAFDIPFSLVAGALKSGTSLTVILSPNICNSWRAMAKHWSQFVWYRAMFLTFSRYGYVNTLRKIC